MRAQVSDQPADKSKMNRGWICILIALLAACGCRQGSGRMSQPEDPQGPYRAQISAAKGLLAQETDWAHQAEWEVTKRGDTWEVIAWRVVHPDRKGAERYLPWGYAVIELDSRLTAVRYRPKG